MATLVGWDVHQAGLADLLQVILRRVSREGDVPFAIEHIDELFEHASLLITPFSSALQCADKNAGVIR